MRHLFYSLLKPSGFSFEKAVRFFKHEIECRRTTDFRFSIRTPKKVFLRQLDRFASITLSIGISHLPTQYFAYNFQLTKRKGINLQYLEFHGIFMINDSRFYIVSATFGIFGKVLRHVTFNMKRLLKDHHMIIFCVPTTPK